MSTVDPTVVCRLGPDDWMVFKEIRVRALRDAPAAMEGKNDRCEFAMSRPLDRIEAPGS